MRLRIKGSALAMLAVGILTGGHLWALSGGNTVEVDGDRISVRAKGITLDELLAVVEEMTGVQFTFTGSVAAKKVFVEFKGLPLSEGIKRIVNPLSCATVYDKRGKLLRVVILGQWKGSGPTALEQEDNESPEVPRGAPATEPPGSDSSVKSRDLPLRKRPLRSTRPPVKSRSSGDEGGDRQDQATENPPVGRVSTGDGPPTSQDQLLEGPPNADVPDHPPPSDSEGFAAEGSPTDRSYSMQGPPAGKDLEMEGPPGAGEAK